MLKKRCKKHGDLAEKDIYQWGRYLRCILCQRSNAKAFLERHPPDYNKNTQKRHYEKARDALSDGYLIRLIKSMVHCKTVDISPEDIQRWRDSVRRYRENKSARQYTRKCHETKDL